MRSVAVSMMLAVLLVMGLKALSAAPGADADAATYTDNQYKFSIDAPAFVGSAAASKVVPVTFTGPPDGKFAPNVNVMIQENQPARTEYVMATAAQVQQMKGKINSQRNLQVSGHDAVEIDYAVPISGRSLRFLTLAVFVDQRVYLTTCTASADAFETHAVEFQKCLDSFKLMP